MVQAGLVHRRFNKRADGVVLATFDPLLALSSTNLLPVLSFFPSTRGSSRIGMVFERLLKGPGDRSRAPMDSKRRFSLFLSYLPGEFDTLNTFCVAGWKRGLATSTRPRRRIVDAHGPSQVA